MRLRTIHLSYTGLYDWTATLHFLAARAVDGVEEIDGTLYKRTVSLGDLAGTLEVGPDASERALVVGLRLPAGTDVSDVEPRLRRMFDLDADHAAIAAHLGRDAVMAPLVAARPWLRVFGGWDGFEVALRTINGQQVSIERARHLNRVLVARAGDHLGGALADGLRRLFPTPRQVLDADLAGMGMPGARVRTLKTVAEAAEADPELFAPGRALDATIAKLRAIPGVGDWTAHYIAMRACRQADAFPAGDVGLLRGAADAQGVRPSPAALLERAEAWRPFRAYAAHHLWAVDSTASAGVRATASPVKVSAPCRPQPPL